VIGAIYVGLRTPKITTASNDRLDLEPLDEAPDSTHRAHVAR